MWRFSYRLRLKTSVTFQNLAFKLNTGANDTKLVPRDRATHCLGTVKVFIRIEAIFIYLWLFLHVWLCDNWKVKKTSRNYNEKINIASIGIKTITSPTQWVCLFLGTNFTRFEPFFLNAVVWKLMGLFVLNEGESNQFVSSKEKDDNY